MRLERWWVGAFIAALAVFGFGQLQAWPFTSWYMFSHVEPSTISVARAVAVAPDLSEHVLGSDVLPLGLLSHRLLERIEKDPAAVCRALETGARLSNLSTNQIRVERLTWHPLVRNGDRPGDERTEVIHTCT